MNEKLFKNLEGICGLSALGTWGCFTFWLVSTIRNDPLVIMGILAIAGSVFTTATLILGIIAGRNRKVYRNNKGNNKGGE